jgi:cytochrome c peroxidase
LTSTRKLERWFWSGVLSCAVIAALSLHFWTRDRAQVTDTALASSYSALSLEPISPIPTHLDLDPRKVDLGRKLFHDVRLSHNDSISCASCHNLATGGTDRMARSIGINGAIGVINAPTVLNSGFNFSQFWDGRAETLEMQIEGPVQEQSEMGSTWGEVIQKLNRSQEYVDAFRQIYFDGIRQEHIKDTIAVFERSLYTPNSRFDRYLRNDRAALTSNEQQGYRLFKSLGCASCHQGVNVGGNMYQKLGVMAPYFSDRGHITRADFGRFNVTGDKKDRYMFKVPTLRNIALTPPYFHDGSAATLADAVRMMGKYQLGRKLTSEEIDLIVEFLKTLTGELNGKPL